MVRNHSRQCPQRLRTMLKVNWTNLGETAKELEHLVSTPLLLSGLLDYQNDD